MRQVGVAVEWVFGDIINYFKFLDFRKNLKIGLSSVGKFYIVSVLPRNSVTCLYGNNTSRFFELDPPTSEEYCLHNADAWVSQSLTEMMLIHIDLTLNSFF